MPAYLRGRWVAWRLGSGLEVEVLDHDVDLEMLLERLKERGIDVRFVYVDYIPDEDVIYIL